MSREFVKLKIKDHEILSMWEKKTKCTPSLKNLKFIMPRRVEGSSKRKKNIHQAQKGASALRQERSLESASKWPKKSLS